MDAAGLRKHCEMSVTQQQPRACSVMRVGMSKEFEWCVAAQQSPQLAALSSGAGVRREVDPVSRQAA